MDLKLYWKILIKYRVQRYLLISFIFQNNIAVVLKKKYKYFVIDCIIKVINFSFLRKYAWNWKTHEEKKDVWMLIIMACILKM